MVHIHTSCMRVGSIPTDAPISLSQKTKTNNMKKTKIYYHILEHCDYGKIGYHGYRENLKDAQEEVNRLSSYFPQYHFSIFQDNSKKEPPITTI